MYKKRLRPDTHSHPWHLGAVDGLKGVKSPVKQFFFVFSRLRHAAQESIAHTMEADVLFCLGLETLMKITHALDAALHPGLGSRLVHECVLYVVLELKQVCAILR